MARTQVLIAAILFGTTGTAQALGPDGSTPMTVGASRILIGGSLLAAIALASGGFRGRWPLGHVLLAGAGVAVYQLAFFQAVADTGVAVGAIVAIGSGPVFAGILERVLDGAWPGRTWLDRDRARHHRRRVSSRSPRQATPRSRRPGSGSRSSPASATRPTRSSRSACSASAIRPSP